MVSRRHSLTAVWAAVVLAALSTGFAPAAKNAAARKKSAQQLGLPQASSVRTFGPFWEVGNGRTTALVLKNKDQQNPVSATITLFSAAGKQEQSTQVQVAAGSTTRLDLADMVKPQGNAVDSGGLFVDSTGVLSGQLTIEGPQTGSFNMALQGGYRYDTENAVYAPWWLPDEGSDGSLTVFNSSTQSVTVTPAVSVASGSEQTGPAFSLAPYASTKLGLRDLIGKNSGGLGTTTGMVTLRYTGPAHALQPALVLSNPSSGFLLAPGFNARHQEQSVAPTGQQATWQFPEVSLVTNAVSATQQPPQALSAFALLSNGSKSSSMPQMVVFYALPNGKKLKKTMLPLAPLMPSETRLVNLSQLLADASVPSGVSHFALSMTHGGDPGDLAISVFSASQANDVVLRSGGVTQPGGVVDVSYWKLATPPAEPTVLNKNHVAVQAQVTVYYKTALGVESYVLPVIGVPAHKTRPLGLRDVMVSGMADLIGNKIPSGVSAGLATLAVVSGNVGTNVPIDMGAECQTDCNVPPPSPSLQSTSALASASANSAQLITPATGVQFADQPGCPPEIDFISPTHGSRGSDPVVQIHGFNLNTSQSVSVSGGISTNIENGGTDGNGEDVLNVDFNISDTATPGPQDVIVSDPTLGDSNAATFTIDDPTPVIASVTQPWNAGTTINVTITGTGFGTNPPTVTISGGFGITYTITGPQIPSDTEIDLRVTVDINAPPSSPSIVVTSNGYGGNHFISSTGGSPNSLPVNVQVFPIVLPQPAIVFGKTRNDCTNPNNQNLVGGVKPVVVGQKIVVVGCINNLPAGVTIASESWLSLSGTTIAGYDDGSAVAQPHPTQARGTVKQVQPTNCGTDTFCAFNPFYWVFPDTGEGFTISFTYQQRYLNGSLSPTQQGSAGVTVSGPGNVQPQLSMQAVTIAPATTQMLLGDTVNQINGMNFNITASPAPAGSGANAAFQWIQLLTTDTYRFLCNGDANGGDSVCTPQNATKTLTCANQAIATGINNSALDNVYPYGSIVPTSSTQARTVDSPMTPSLGINQESEASRSFNATMYLLWDPALNVDGSNCQPATSHFPLQVANTTQSTCDSIPVPIGSVSWHWSGDSLNTRDPQQGVNGWALSCGNPAQPNPNPNPGFVFASSSAGSSNYPTWNTHETNGLVKDQYPCVQP